MVVNPYDVVSFGEYLHDLVLARGIVIPRTRQAYDDASFNHVMVSRLQVGRDFSMSKPTVFPKSNSIALAAA